MHRPFWLWLACLWLLFGAAGCKDQSDRVPLGYFAVVGTLTEQCASEGLLSAPAQAALRVHLQRFDRTIHWDDGTGLKTGEYSPEEHSFEVVSSLFVDMRQDQQMDFLPEEEPPPCTIERRLIVDATFTGDEAGGFEGFEGTLSYLYDPTDGSTCTDLVEGEAPIAEALPCTVAFAITATPMK